MQSKALWPAKSKIFRKNLRQPLSRGPKFLPERDPFLAHETTETTNISNFLLWRLFHLIPISVSGKPSSEGEQVRLLRSHGW